jgi:hypothetical protein
MPAKKPATGKGNSMNTSARSMASTEHSKALADAAVARKAIDQNAAANAGKK